MARRKTLYEKHPHRRREVEGKLIKRFNGIAICAYCGIEAEGEDVTLDHVIPVSRGGTDRMSNMVLCCAKCNTKKGNKMWEPKYRKLKDLSPERRPPKRTKPPIATVGDAWPEIGI